MQLLKYRRYDSTTEFRYKLETLFPPPNVYVCKGGPGGHSAGLYSFNINARQQARIKAKEQADFRIT